MPLYNYQAKDKNGKMVSGSLESPSKDQVIGRLQTMGFYPMNVSEILSDKGLHIL